MAGTCEALTIEENMALAWKRGERRVFGFALNRNLREMFREKLSILKLGLENRLADRIGLLSGGYGEEELDRAGAYRVFADPAAMLHHLDELGVRST